MNLHLLRDIIGVTVHARFTLFGVIIPLPPPLPHTASRKQVRHLRSLLGIYTINQEKLAT